MHYGDKEQLEQNILSVVIYVHETDDPDKTLIDMTSIHECKYVHPVTLMKFLNCYDILLKDFAKMIRVEDFYLVHIKFKGFDVEEFEIQDFSIASDKNGFYTLH